MILSGKEIKKRLGKDIFIDPFDDRQMGPNSYNVRLHHDLMVYEDSVLDMKVKPAVRAMSIPVEGLVLKPGQLYLARTVERTKTVGCVPMLEGRSSVGRLGLFIHITAGFGDIGFTGFWTLEMFCVKPIRVYAGVEIAQLFYHEIQGDFELYKKKYQNNYEIQPSMIYKDFQESTY